MLNIYLVLQLIPEIRLRTLSDQRIMFCIMHTKERSIKVRSKMADNRRLRRGAQILENHGFQ